MRSSVHQAKQKQAATSGGKSVLGLRQFRPVLFMGVIYLGLGIWQPGIAGRSVRAFGLSLREVMMIMPGISIIMGLFEVWVPKSMVETYLGKGSGLKGYILAFVFGTAPTGPLLGAFPVARGLLEKGATVGAVTVFLGAWGAAKIPQLMMEAKFLGGAFTATRFVLTALAVGLMGLLASRLMESQQAPNPGKGEWNK